MDNAQYLKQISSAPLKAPTKSNKFSSFIIKLLAGLLAAIIFLIVIINTLGASNNRIASLTETLHTRLTLLSTPNGPIGQYGKLLSSSSLRALSANLQASLANTSHELTNLLPELGITPQITDEETDHISALTSSLESARLNALLDRTFSREITLQIAQILSIESELYERTQNPSLRSLLSDSTANLQHLSTQFTNFSNTSS